MKFTKETWRRAARTFVQVAIPLFLANMAALDFTKGKTAVKLALASAAVAALSAGLAAVMNLEERYDD